MGTNFFLKGYTMRGSATPLQQCVAARSLNAMFVNAVDPSLTKAVSLTNRNVRGAAGRVSPHVVNFPRIVIFLMGAFTRRTGERLV